MRLFSAIQKILVAFLLLLPAAGDCQLPPGDSSGLFREFMARCDMYRHLPVQVTLHVTHATNLISAKEDTASEDIQISLRSDGSYTKYNELEQLGNDSLVLLVNPTARRMFLYRNHASIAGRLQMRSAWMGADSSLERMQVKYQAVPLAPAGNQPGILLSSKEELYGISLPVTTVALRYDAASLELTSVVQVQRKLVSVDAAVYQQRQADPAFAGKLVRASSGEFLVVKEMTTSYQYLSVRHAEEALPVRMSDRVMLQAAGKFEPAAAYQSFTLNQR